MDFLKTENMLFVLTLIPTPSPSPRPHIMLAHTNSTYYTGGSKKQIYPNDVCFIKMSLFYIFSKEGRTNCSSVYSIGFYRQRKMYLIFHVLRYIDYDLTPWLQDNKRNESFWTQKWENFLLLFSGWINANHDLTGKSFFLGNL